jgi:hypothetical protein
MVCALAEFFVQHILASNNLGRLKGSGCLGHGGVSYPGWSGEDIHAKNALVELAARVKAVRRILCRAEIVSTELWPEAKDLGRAVETETNTTQDGTAHFPEPSRIGILTAQPPSVVGAR